MLKSLLLFTAVSAVFFCGFVLSQYRDEEEVEELLSAEDIQAIDLSALASDISRNQKLPGHMEPLGSNMEEQLEVVSLEPEQFPDSLEFFDRFVKPSRPVLFRGMAKRFPSYDNWRNDSYLK